MNAHSMYDMQISRHYTKLLFNADAHKKWTLHLAKRTFKEVYKTLKTCIFFTSKIHFPEINKC